MSHDLDDLLVVHALVAQSLHIGRINLATFVDQLQHKAQHGGSARVGRFARLRGGQGLATHARLAAEGRVGGQAVVAGIAVGHGHGDLLTQGGADHAPAQRTKRAPHALQRGGRIGHGAEHVGRGAKGTVDLVEHGAHSAGGGGTVNEGDAGDGGRSSGHGVFLEGHEGD